MTFILNNSFPLIKTFPPSVLFENPKVTEWLEKPQVIEISHHVIKRNKACWPKHDPLTAGDLSKRILQLYPQLYKSTLPHANYDETTKSNDLAVKLENVFFKYKKSDELTLKDINLEIKKRDFVAIIGHNGAGKSGFSSAIISPLATTNTRSAYGKVMSKL
ncbi:ATP-binding cassette domain-containing protein [Bacillus gobiensis]|uniref:ATP-binding cassette domain-containing protein n=1 Tax=Bacillus gobiensis TaxID=1441095 RepID=UPI003D21D84C